MDPLTGKEIARDHLSLEEIDGRSQRSIETENLTEIPYTQNDSLPYLFGNRVDYSNLVVPLYEASIIGDWETANSILNKRRDLISVGLSRNLGTALHVAVTAEETKITLNFVKNLVNMMTVEELEIQNKYWNTAFWIASAGGNTKMAMIMMEKNRRLPDIRGTAYLPLTIAAITGTNNIVKYLYEKSQRMRGDHWTNDDRNLTLLHCVERDFFDVALQILEDHPKLAGNMSILEILSRKPDAINEVEKNLFTRIKEASFRFFRSKVHPNAEDDNDALKLLKIIWGHATQTMSFDEIEDMLDRPPTFAANESIIESSRILLVAAKTGNTRFIVELLRSYPDLMLFESEDGLTLFHVAVMHRHQGIYNLLYEIGGSNNDICLSIDKSGNNMLHLVGKSSKEMAAKTSGASLLMQRELLWFKEVEKMMPPYMREARNHDGQTPYELFSKENEDLLSRGLKWMKDCMVVATLIVTIAFAVAFTVPGGYNQEFGIPVFIHDRTFLVFVIADAISLFSSSTSLLVFLSILTSPHDQRDFMYSLPRKLMIGVLTLFISVAAMMVTFSVSFFVLYDNRLKWVPVLIALFASIPVIVFAVMQFPLMVDMFRSMYDSHYLFKPKKHILYTTKVRLHSIKMLYV
ncbi:uncharacterized protein LOC143613249 [Bidens hawaiensis]|uniref:uncharacterized protein LOC143613249 n=1 Tax=Bidens hawaiensis TaxID=980011 RepID=UPI004049CF3F